MALRAANGNPDLAFEYLLAGEDFEQEMIEADAEMGED
jgi:hypothetical protein